ncbi:MAG: LysR family transcriptional regulator [Rhizobiales bacterium]|nr:LysR family transcriptional regulator [Hyphomicrobiales bacterium]
MARTDLPALTVFASVAANSSFRGAATQLGISPSAVSHAVSGLEAALGVRLLARTTRSVALTEAGSRLIARIGPALEEIAAALEDTAAAGGRPAGRLRLSVPLQAAELMVAPQTGHFAAAYPDVTLELVVQDGFVDLVASGFDAGMRLGESLEQDMIAIRIGPDMRMAAVATPDYFQRFPPPLHPSDLRRHVCIGRRFTGGGLYRWEFEKDGEALEIAVDGRLVFNEGRLITAAALAGAGLAYVMEAMVADEIASGKLTRVLGDWCPPFPGFFLYYPSRRQMRPALRAFIDFFTGANGE